jgi:hypothetical protein
MTGATKSVTTTHWPGALHDALVAVPESTGSDGSAVHDVPPLQTNARSPVAEPKSDVWARHQSAVGHDSPVTPRTALFVTAGRSCHDVPFQCRLVKPPKPPDVVMQLLALPQEISSGWPVPAGWVAQVDPLNLRTIGTRCASAPAAVYWTEDPMAVQAVALVQETCCSCSEGEVPVGTGVVVQVDPLRRCAVGPPTDTHEVADAQPRLMAVAAAVVGVVVHAVPFHLPRCVALAGAFLPPTHSAVQLVADAQATDGGSVGAAPVKVIGVTDQAAPFQRSTSGPGRSVRIGVQ